VADIDAMPRVIEPTHQPPLLLRIARRIGIGVLGWLFALPFVLTGPVIFWLIFAHWDSDSPPQGLKSHAQIVYWIGSAHAVVFLTLGLPLFLVFWGRRSLIWHLPNSLLLGFLLGTGAGFPHYYSSPRFYDRVFFICAGYGVATAFGCWLANWTRERRARKFGKASLPPKSSFTYRFTKLP
jgi:hypothetical protein